MTNQEEKIFQKLNALANASRRAFEHFQKGRDDQSKEWMLIAEKELDEAKRFIEERNGEMPSLQKKS